MPNHKGSKVVTTKYHWCTTRDVCNLTIAGRQRSMIRRGGLIYSQFYAMDKLQLDANKHFPWPDEDDSMIMMAISERHREALRASVGSQAINMRECRRSYLHSGRRFLMATRMNDGRSWGVREEHRVDLQLFQAILDELNSGGNPELRWPETQSQFYVHPTKIVNEFAESVALSIASWYQATLSMVPEGMLGADHQKLAYIQLLLLKHSYAYVLLSACPKLWKTVVPRDGEDEQVWLGLGLKHTVNKYGFGWLPNTLFHWPSNAFVHGCADWFIHPVKRLDRRYRAQPTRRQRMLHILEELDQVLSRLGPRIVDCEGQISVSRRCLLRWVAMQIIRQYHQDFWDTLYRSSLEFSGKWKEAVRMGWEESGGSGHVQGTKRKRTRVNMGKTWDILPSLTYQQVKAEIQEEPISVGRAVLYPCKKSVYELIFQLGRQEQAKPCEGAGWKNKPYLHSLVYLRERLDPSDFDIVRLRLWFLFKNYCHCVPNITRSRWLASVSSFRGKPAWIAFNGVDGERFGVHVGDASQFLGPKNTLFSSNCSWRFTRSIHEDRDWDRSLEDALNEYEMGEDM
jgi:hypothetical protein